MKGNTSIVQYRQPRKGSHKTKLLLYLLLLCSGGSLMSQYDQTPYGTTTPRSIWDKEPEPKPDPSPYGTLVTPQQNAQLQQNVTLGNPPAFDAGTQDGVPIDGGLSLLMAAGALYGARRTYKAVNKTQKGL